MLKECNNYEVVLQHLRQIVNKVSRENLKPRKGDEHKLQFIQCNMQKSQHAQIDLNRRISQMNKAQERFIRCIQEPCLVKSQLIGQPNSVQRYGKAICPRTCIYTDNKTNAWFLEAISLKDVTAIQVSILQQDILVVSAYMDSTNIMVWGNELDVIVEYAANNSLGLIMCIDSNWHSTLFGPDTNNRGLKLEEALASNKLNVKNISHVVNRRVFRYSSRRYIFGKGLDWPMASMEALLSYLRRIVKKTS